MPNILFITNSISFGGASKMLCFVAESLANRGHNVTVANLRATNNVTDYERTLNCNVNVRIIENTPRGKNKNLYRIKELTRIAKECGAEVVIGFTSFPNMYANIVGKIRHVPSIMSERGDPSCTTDHSIKSKVLNAIVNRSQGGVFQTDGAKEYYGKGLQKRGIVIPNPIFIEDEIPDVVYADREKTVVSVGRLDIVQKRCDIMLESFQVFGLRHPEYTLKIYGKGSNEKQIHSYAEKLGIVDKVFFMGLTTQPMQDISRDGMFLITSDYEGISNSLLEAMAVGLPCVSTDHTPGGARLLIQNHKNGLLAPIADVEKLAEAMCEYAENPELAEKCGNNAKDVVKQFHPKRIIDMWENYILRLCK